MDRTSTFAASHRVASHRVAVSALAVLAASVTALVAIAGPAGSRPADSTEITAEAVDATPPSLLVADVDGKVSVVDPVSGELDPILTTSEPIGGISATSDRSQVFVARHDPLVGLPCTATVEQLDVASPAEPVRVIPGFAPSVGPGDERVAVVSTVPSPTGECAFGVDVVDLESGVTTTVLAPDPAIGICGVDWVGDGELVVEQCDEGGAWPMLVTLVDRAVTPLHPDRAMAVWALPRSDHEGGVVAIERCCLDRPLQAVDHVVAISAGGEQALTGAIPGSWDLAVAPDGTIVVLTDMGGSGGSVVRAGDHAEVAAPLADGVVAIDW